MENIVTTTLRTPKDLHSQLKEAAKKRGYTLNSLFLQILRDWATQNLDDQDSA